MKQFGYFSFTFLVFIFGSLPSFSIPQVPNPSSAYSGQHLLIDVMNNSPAPKIKYVSHEPLPIFR